MVVQLQKVVRLCCLITFCTKGSKNNAANAVSGFGKAILLIILFQQNDVCSCTSQSIFFKGDENYLKDQEQ